MASSNRPGAVDGQRALAAWRDDDLLHALHGPDRVAIAAHDAARALILELLAREQPGRDLYSACARLGRLLADAGASPSLAVATLDGAARALASLDAPFDRALLPSARASVAEGYVAAMLEGERLAARRTWEYPACATRIAKDSVAIAVGFPEDDPDAFGDWCARVAIAVSRDGHRTAILSGAPSAKAQLAQALGSVGVTVTESQGAAAPKRSWFSWAGARSRRTDEG